MAASIAPADRRRSCVCLPSSAAVLRSGSEHTRDPEGEREKPQGDRARTDELATRDPEGMVRVSPFMHSRAGRRDTRGARGDVPPPQHHCRVRTQPAGRTLQPISLRRLEAHRPRVAPSSSRV